MPNCNCFDWSFPCQVAVPGFTFLESSSQNSSAISRNNARKKYVFLLMSLNFLKFVLWNAPTLLNLGKEKWKFSGWCCGKKSCLWGFFCYFSEDADKNSEVLWIKTSKESSDVSISLDLPLLSRHHLALSHSDRDKDGLSGLYRHWN